MIQRFIYRLFKQLPTDDRRRRMVLAALIVGLSLATVFIINLFATNASQPEKTKEAYSAHRAVEAAVRETEFALDAGVRKLESRPEAKPFEFSSGQKNRDWESGQTLLLKGNIQPGQSFFVSLTKRNIPAGPTQRLIDASRDVFDFQKCRPGDPWLALVGPEGLIRKFKYEVSTRKQWKAIWQPEIDKYRTTKIKKPVETRLDTITGVVDASLWRTLQSKGERGELIYDFADIFAYSIDFNTETRPGDKFTIVVEKEFLEGDFLDYGTILAAEYINRGDQMRAYYFETEKERFGYYTQKGKNLERQFLKSPLASIRITSRYGERHHPVLGETRMHNGVDYGAPVGTPIRSVADGTVVFAGWEGANGRLITLRHANGYITHYAHLADIHVAPGERVEKKEIIGEVGNTGRSTGPHLHFGMKQYGDYVNPLEIETDRAPPLKGDQKESFKKEVVPPMRARLEVASVRRQIEIPFSLKDIPLIKADE